MASKKANAPKKGPSAPGGIPARQPRPEVPAREHPLPRPQEVPADPGPAQEIPVEAPEGPGPAAV
jgi:hypothetical protein